MKKESIEKLNKELEKVRDEIISKVENNPNEKGVFSTQIEIDKNDVITNLGTSYSKINDSQTEEAIKNSRIEEAINNVLPKRDYDK